MPSPWRPQIQDCADTVCTIGLVPLRAIARSERFAHARVLRGDVPGGALERPDVADQDKEPDGSAFTKNLNRHDYPILRGRKLGRGHQMH